MVRRVVSREEKQAEMQAVAESFENSASIVIIDYLGLNVAEVTELRKNLRENGVQMKVVKNSILRRAADQVGLEGLDEVFAGPTAICISEDDVVAPAKVLVDAAEDFEALEIKGGIIEGKVSSIEEIQTVAKLPSREGLLSMLLSVLEAPMRNTASVLSQANPARKMAYALKAVSDQKGAA